METAMSDINQSKSLRRTTRINVDKLLDRLEAFHDALAGHYTAAAADMESERVRLLLEYLAPRERAMAAQFPVIRADIPLNLQSRWFKYAPETPIRELAQQAPLPPHLTDEELAGTILDVYESLTQVLAPMQGNAESEALEEVLSTLHTLEREHALKSIRAVVAGQ